jgi:hypothetical protein
MLVARAAGVAVRRLVAGGAALAVGAGAAQPARLCRGGSAGKVMSRLGELMLALEAVLEQQLWWLHSHGAAGTVCAFLLQTRLALEQRGVPGSLAGAVAVGHVVPRPAGHCAVMVSGECSQDGAELFALEPEPCRQHSSTTRSPLQPLRAATYRSAPSRHTLPGRSRPCSGRGRARGHWCR